MLSELEIEAIIKDEELRNNVYQLKKEFLKSEAPYMEISDEDFLGLIFLTPSIKIALADGSVSFFEERQLQRKARSVSKGRFWLKKDPVTVAMNFLIKNYIKWEDRFFDVLKDILARTFQQNELLRAMLRTGDVSSQSLHKDLINTPALFTRMFASFFVNKDEELIKSKNISELQFRAIEETGIKLGFQDLPLYQKFMATYTIK